MAMATLGRYLRREIAGASVFVLLALTGIFALFDLINQMGDLGRLHYQFLTAMGFVALLVPAHAYELMPIAALIGTIYALSKLAASSEFTIMRVSGMTTVRLALTVARVGVLLVAVAYVLGEVIAPPAEDLGQRLKASAIGAAVGQEFRSGVWVRDQLRGADGRAERVRFVNVGSVDPGGTVVAWRIFEFDPQLRLRAIATASRGTFRENEGWLLDDVVETQLPAVASLGAAQAAAELPPIDPVRVERAPQRLWRTDLTPGIFGVLMIQPERQSALNLVRYIRHLAENHQRTDRYEIALWKKVLYPLVCVVMMALALPFAYLHVRSGTVGLKIFGGIMLGVFFYAINKLFSHLGLINTWPPALVAALPALVALALAAASLYWIERR